MANKIIAGFVGGMVTTLFIIFFLFAWAMISNALKQIDPNNAALEQVINNSDKAVNEVITWHQIIGGIEDVVFILGLIAAGVYGLIKLIDHFNPSYESYHY